MFVIVNDSAGIEPAGFYLISMCRIRDLPHKLGSGTPEIPALLSARGRQGKRICWKANR